VENCNLEALADAKAYTVALLILTPLRIQGATGSPLRAIAAGAPESLSRACRREGMCASVAV